MPFKNRITDDIRELIQSNEKKGKKIEKLHVNPEYENEILSDPEFTRIQRIEEQMTMRIAKFHNVIILIDSNVDLDQIVIGYNDYTPLKIYKRSQKTN